MKNLIPAAFVLLLSVALSAFAQKDNTSRWVHQDGTNELSVTVRNNVRFNDDFTDVSSIEGDGSLEVLERQGALTRRLRITAGATGGGGQLVRSYSVNGETRAFDADARTWLAKMLADAVGSGFEARARAQQIVRQRGSAALLSEIPRLKGDHTKRVYLEEALKSGNLNGAALQDALTLAGRDISSDHEKATFLINAAGTTPLPGRGGQDVYFAAVGTIKSDYEHARVLKAVLKANPANKEILMLAAASASGIKSDYEKANVLIQIAKTNAPDEGVRKALLSAVKTMSSDHERGRVLNAFYLNDVK